MSDDLMLGNKRSRLLEAAIWVPNLFLIVIVVLYLVFSGISGPRVHPLVKTDQQTTDRIKRLEQRLQRGAKGGASALELARLYSQAGEYPWSVDALRSAERSGSSDPVWKMKLGLAFLELGNNIDGLRVLKRALLACERARCKANVKAKLEIFTRVAEVMMARKINARRDQVAAAKVFDEVLKPVRPDRLSRKKVLVSPPKDPPAHPSPGKAAGNEAPAKPASSISPKK